MVSRLRAAMSSTPDTRLLNSIADAGFRSSKVKTDVGIRVGIAPRRQQFRCCASVGMIVGIGIHGIWPP